MVKSEIEMQVDRIIEVADTLRMKSNHDGMDDDLDALAEELQSIAEAIQREVEE